MASRKRRAPESSVATAQRAASERRKEREQETKQRQEDTRKRAAQQPTALAAATVDPRTGLTIPAPGAGRPGDPVGRGANLAAQGKSDGSFGKPVPAAQGLSEAADKIAGLGSGIMQVREKQRRALADPSLFGVSDRAIKARITEQKNAIQQFKNKKLKDAGGAVYWGTKQEQIRRPQRGGEFEGGTNRIPASVATDDVRNKDELISMLTDEGQFNEIKKRAQAAGLDVQDYGDVAKLWESVVKQAAAAYSTSGKKVTPWAIMQLMGKQAVNGRPASKTTTSTSIEDLDPAQARLMVERSATDLLGRAPTKAELDDFVSKAQTIARANPRVTKTTTDYDFAGDPTNQTSTSTGGAEVVNAQAQVAAQDMAKQDEEYGAFQAAGFYMPTLFDALASPI